MSWFEEQIQMRRKLDEQELEDAYARLASSVMGGGPDPVHDDAAAADSAIGIVLSYYNTKPVHVPDEITNPMDRVEWASRPTGIMHRTVRLEGQWWRDATGAYLATTLDDTLVALIPRSPRGYAYVDPLTHKRVRLNKKSAANLKPEALCFYRPLPQRELSLRDVGLFMARSLDVLDYMHMIVAMIVSTIIGMLPATASRILFARIIPSGMPSLIAPVAALLVGMTFSQTLIRITTSVITQRLTTKLQVQMEAATYARVMLLPPTFFKSYAAGDLARRVMGMAQLVNILSQSVFSIGIPSIFSLVYVAQILMFAPSLALPALIISLLELAASILVTIRTMSYSRVEMKAATKLSGLTPTILHGIQKIKLAGAESRSFAHWARSYADLSEATYRRPALLLAGPLLVPLISSAGTIVLYGLAAQGGVSIPDYMAFNTAFGSVSAAITSVVGMSTTVATLRPLLELVEPIMKAVPEVLSNQEQIESISGSIEVNNLSFGYTANDQLVLKNLSMSIRPREYIAIVGSTGCGKSTLMRLLLGFEKPTRGAIYYGGKDISNIDIRSLRRHIGVVLQNGSLLAGDILMNITVACPGATLDDAWDAAEVAGIANDIRRMPMGMQTLISEGGGSISGGQRQRLLIARAVCGKPKILMLDEATSALDNITQRHVSDALDNLKCTRIVIAHRLSTIRHADRIFVLDDGTIAESGTYDELMAANGTFAELVKRQRLEYE